MSMRARSTHPMQDWIPAYGGRPRRCLNLTLGSNLKKSTEKEL